MHRNIFRQRAQGIERRPFAARGPHIFLAGQITGVEGYVESAANGLWLGLALAAKLCGAALPPPPVETTLGALLGHLRTPVKKISAVQRPVRPHARTGPESQIRA